MESAFEGFRGINFDEYDTRTAKSRRTRFGPLLSFAGAMLCTPFAILLCKAIIGIVSGYDVFLTIRYVESLPMMEANPVGRWMMGFNKDYSQEFTQGTLEHTAFFITAKFFGNFVVFGVIEALAHWRRPMAAMVATTLAFTQLCLLYYLVFGSI